jgi:purine-binding chemotaxis protein CheW
MERPVHCRQYATFVVGDLFFGVDVQRIQEVLRRQEMTAAPGADGVIRGLINLRGQIVAALDMRRRLKLAQRDAGEPSMNVVLRSADAVSLLVDDIGDVIEADPDGFEPPPATMEPSVRELLEGVYQLEDRLLLILSADQVLKP